MERNLKFHSKKVQ